MQTQFHDYLGWYMGTIPYTEEPEALPPLQCKGRAITISREYGCEAVEIGRSLVLLLNKKDPMPDDERWMLVDKDVLHRVSSELSVSSSKLNKAKTPIERGIIESIIKAFDKDHNVMDNNLVKALHSVIGTYLLRGNVIIVGRGAVAFTKDLPQVLNVRLVASEKYRVETIMHKKELSYEKAQKLVDDMNKRRNAFLEYIAPEIENPTFDLVIDREKFTSDAIINMIYQVVDTMPIGVIKGD
ncbi:cytidylate kinase-like family protein [Limibacter armeniacum]|uniref:cytidylate kinase-like family protein n=1 Tax=Limibacter armeniacum TaxID=466084 RepID=UPI002FE6130C